MKPEHSPLGASSAERWMSCPGSVSLLKELKLPETDEPDYRREGTAMHHAASHCLEYEKDTWEITGATFYDTVIDEEMAQHIQTYLDWVRGKMRTEEYVQHWVEFALAHPTHPLFYGTVDFGLRLTTRLGVTDLKGGIGIRVDAERNPQLMYYAYLLIVKIEELEGKPLPDDFPVDLEIVQPRAFSPEGAIRTWETTVGEIKEWVHDTLIPAMAAAEYDKSLDSGPWCRFCPAKLVCPLLTSLFRAAALYDPKEIVHYTAETVGRSYQYAQAVKHYIKALEDDAGRRLNAGEKVPGVKLVPKEANRVFTPEGQKLAGEKFGEEAFEPAKLKSPAQLEKVSPAARDFVKEHAYKPNTGETVALDSDPRPAIVKQTAAEAFGAAVAELTK